VQEATKENAAKLHQIYLNLEKSLHQKIIILRNVKQFEKQEKVELFKNIESEIHVLTDTMEVLKSGCSRLSNKLNKSLINAEILIKLYNKIHHLNVRRHLKKAFSITTAMSLKTELLFIGGSSEKTNPIFLSSIFFSKNNIEVFRTDFIRIHIIKFYASFR